MKLQLAALALFTGTAFGTPIAVTGFGSFSLDNYFDTYANVCLFGDGVSTCLNNVPIGPAPPVMLSQLTAADVCGDIGLTSYEQFGTRFVDGVLNTNWWGRGTFTVGASDPIGTPEPGSGWLFGIGLGGIWAGRKRFTT